MSVSFIALSVLFFGFYALLSNFKKQKKSFNFRVLSALAAGLLFGGAIQLVFGVGNVATSGFAELISVFGKGYIKLLQMIVIPLVFVAMISSIMNVEGGGALSRIAPKIIGILLFTCAISAAVGIASIYLFGIDANALVSTIGTNSAIEARGDSLVATQDAMASSGLSGMALSIIPTNIFDMLTGSQRTSTLSTVLFGMFLGYCILQVKNRKPEKVLLQQISAELTCGPLYLVHRLDKMTSGLLLLARHAQAASILSQQFQQRTVEKYYLALSDQKPRKKQGLIKGDMERSRRGSWKLTTGLRNPAITRFFSCAPMPGLRLFLLRPLTGKTHQLRVALKSVGAAIIGDTRYHGVSEPSADRGYLHAWGLAFDWQGERQTYLQRPMHACGLTALLS